MTQDAAAIAEGFGARPDQTEMDSFLGDFDCQMAEEFGRQMRAEQNSTKRKRITTFGFLDIAPFARNAIEAIQQDSFTQCFQVRAGCAHVKGR
jgi:hypothetical protein